MKHATFAALMLASCSWELERMNDQPRCEPGEATSYLPDRRCVQEPPTGAIAWRSNIPVEVVAPTRATIARGQDRYTRFCAPCHGVAGDGRSAVAKDMLLRPPPSLHQTLIVDYPDQRLFNVISEGFGLMPSYATALPPTDRWAIVHFVRVLQRSQAVALDELSPTQRKAADRWLR